MFQLIVTIGFILLLACLGSTVAWAAARMLLARVERNITVNGPTTRPGGWS